MFFNYKTSLATCKLSFYFLAHTGGEKKILLAGACYEKIERILLHSRYLDPLNSFRMSVLKIIIRKVIFYERETRKIILLADSQIYYSHYLRVWLDF